MRNNNKIYLKRQNIPYVCGIFVFLKTTDCIKRYLKLKLLSLLPITCSQMFTWITLTEKKCKRSHTQQHLPLWSVGVLKPYIRPSPILWLPSSWKTRILFIGVGLCNLWVTFLAVQFIETSGDFFRVIAINTASSYAGVHYCTIDAQALWYQWDRFLITWYKQLLVSVSN